MCAGTDKDVMFACLLVGLQLLTVPSNYNVPSFGFHNSLELETYYLNYDITKDQEPNNSKDHLILAGYGIGPCKQKTWNSHID